MEHKRDLSNKPGFENDLQVEGVPGITNEKSKYCSKCDYVDNTEKVKFCPNDGTQLKQFEPSRPLNELKNIRPLGLTIQCFIQLPKENWKYTTTVGELKKINCGMPQKYQNDLFITWISMRSNWNTENVVQYSDPNLTSVSTVLHVTEENKTHVFDLKYTYRSGVWETLYNILVSLIHYEITNPRCVNPLFMICSINFKDTKYKDEDKVELTLSPVRNGEPPTLISNKEDIWLKEALMKVQQDVFYSRTLRRLFDIDELLDIFKLEGKIFKNLNFRAQSKKIKIFNVNVYILNESVDGLFFFVEARKHTEKIKELQLHESFSAPKCSYSDADIDSIVRNLNKINTTLGLELLPWPPKNIESRDNSISKLIAKLFGL